MSDRPSNDSRYGDLARQWEKRRRVHVGAIEYEPPEAAPPACQNVGTISYGRPTDEPKPRMPGVVQYLAGLLTPFTVIAVMGALGLAGSASRAVVPGAFFSSVIASCVLARTVLKWRAFIPGTLTALLLLPVLAVVAICVVCGVHL